MGQVAFVTRLALGVLVGLDLREPFRSGNADSVTRHAQRPHLGELDRNLARTFGMRSQSTVTRLTADGAVSATDALGSHVVVALLAHRAPGKNRHDRAIVFQRSAAEVPNLAEVRRNQNPPEDHKYQEADGEETGHPDQVFFVSEQLAHDRPPVIGDRIFLSLPLSWWRV